MAERLLTPARKRSGLWACATLAAAYFLWEAGEYRGLYRWLAEAQLWWWGWYIPMLNFAALALIFVVPAAILLRRGREVEHLRSSAANDPVFARRVAGRTLSALWLGGGLLAFAAAATLIFAFVRLPETGLPQQTVSAGAITPGRLSEAPTRLIGVAPGRVAVFGAYWPWSRERIAFAPAFATGSDERTVRYFIQVLPVRTPDGLRFPAHPGATSYNGTLVKGGLPGTMRRLFTAMGTPPSAEYYTLYATPAAMRFGYYVTALQFAACALLLLAIALFQRRHVRRLEQG